MLGSGGPELLGDAGRLVIRPSGTEPLIRVMAEAENEAVLREVITRSLEHAGHRVDRASSVRQADQVLWYAPPNLGWDLAATVAAVLLDTEAQRSVPQAGDGRLREPRRALNLPADLLDRGAEFLGGGMDGAEPHHRGVGPELRRRHGIERTCPLNWTAADLSDRLTRH